MRPRRFASGPRPFLVSLQQLNASPLLDVLRPPKKLSAFMSISTNSFNVWANTESALSLSHFLTNVRITAKQVGVLTACRPISLDLGVWSILQSLSAKAADVFISTLQQRSHSTLELVSISSPVPQRMRLSAWATMQSLDGNSRYIFSLQMNSFVGGGVTCVRLLPNTDLVDARLCPYSQTLKHSHATLVPTLGAQLAIESLLTRECAQFAMRSLFALRTPGFRGPMETGPSGDEVCLCWD